MPALETTLEIPQSPVSHTFTRLTEGAENVRPGTGLSTESASRPGSERSWQTRSFARSHGQKTSGLFAPSDGVPSPTGSRAGPLSALRTTGLFGHNDAPVSPIGRPISATSRASKSHAPSLSSHAFFRPMSSRRLQAQRAARPPVPSAIPGDRQSTRSSIITDIVEVPDGAPKPLSQGTEYTREDDQTTLDLSLNNYGRNRNWSDSKRPLQQQTPTPRSRQEHEAGINYQYFSGNTIFFLGGRIQNARDRPVNIFSGLCVIVPALLFLIFSGPYLSREASAAIPFFFAYLAFICMSSFVHASVTDPGILPRHLHQMPSSEGKDPLQLGPPLTQWTMIKSAASATAAMDVPTKYCKTCNIWRPPRCHHCRVCDNCVEAQDHHCVWINNCVGRRNYRYFFAFVTTASALAIFLAFASLGHCLHYASATHTGFARSIDINRVPFAMFIYGLLAAPYPVSLVVYHLWLTGRGETTREYLNSQKFHPQDRHRPFTHGRIWTNWVIAFVRPRPPTYLRFKDAYEHGDQRLGSRRGKMGLWTPRLRRRSLGVELQDVRVPEAARQIN